MLLKRHRAKFGTGRRMVGLPTGTESLDDVLAWFGIEHGHELVTQVELDTANDPIAPPGFKVERFEENCQVVQMQVPTPFINRYYRDLFMELLLTQGIMSIGIYRTQHVHNSQLPYVVANPPPLTVLHADDRLFILCSKQLIKRATDVTNHHKAVHSDKLGHMVSDLAEIVLTEASALKQVIGGSGTDR